MSVTKFNPAEATGDMKSLSQALFKCNGSIDGLRSLAPLPKDAQEMVDNAVVSVGLDRLVIVEDLLAEGLSFNLPNPMSVMELYWEAEAKVGAAVRTMIPGTRDEDQGSERSGSRIPIYATLDGFNLNIRTLLAAERSGVPLDTSLIEQATRRVNESIEDACINGGGISVGGNATPGIIGGTNVNTIAYSGSNPAWDHASKTGDEILADVLSMIDALQADKKFGPYNLYVPTDYGNTLNNDFKAASDKTILQRILEVQAGGRGLKLRVADQLPDDRVIMLQPTSDVIDVVMGQAPTVVSWQDGPGWNTHFAVLAFVIPRIKSDYDGNSGIVVGNTT